ncbi:MAG: hypothetical protein HKN13_03740, partial [Rhodothermales bacterium]|nr:hypothetical protein [Rhodothermales bacterium]
MERAVAVALVILALSVSPANLQAQIGGTSITAERVSIDQYRPRIAAAADGSFAIAWETLEESQFATEWKIAVQRYAANGSPVGPLNLFDPESGCFALDSWTFDGMQNVELAFNGAGQLLVLMEHFGEYDIITTSQRSSELTLGLVDQNGAIVDLGNSANCLQHKFIFVGADEQDRPRMAQTNSGLVVITDAFFGGANFRNVGMQFYDLALNEVGEVVIPHDDEGSLEGFHVYPDVATNGSTLLATWHECPYIDGQGNIEECDVMVQFA